MIQLRDRKISRLRVAAVLMCLCSWAILVSGQSTTKKPAAPAKPAAAPAKPAGNSTKPATSSPARPGAATTNHPTANAPTANRSSAPMANGSRPTGTNRPATTTAGGARPAGASAPRTATGHVAPAGSHTVATRNGAVTRRADGRISDVHDSRRGMDIHHGLDGGRRVSVERRDGSRLVAERGRRGFVERPYQYHGHDFARRSYYYHGVRYDGYYNHYNYHGVFVDVYAPAVFFAPGFYGWAYNPWSAAIAYSAWGWAGTPWFGFYGAYFTPWQTYPSASFWLADYLLAADLQAVYAAQAGALTGGGAIQVPAAQPWTDSGMQVVAGQTYTIASSGLINYSTGNTGNNIATPDGRHDIGGCRPGEAHPQNVAPALSCVALIGRVGPDGVPFAVGRATTIVAPASGELFFGVNDCVSCFADNSGAWVATVTPAGGDAGAAQTADASGAAPLTPEVKQAIADEVKNQLALENAEAAQVKTGQDVDAGSSGIGRLIQDVGTGHPHIFVVGDSLDVTSASTQQECHLSEGDAVQMVTAPASDATAADLVVKSSKGGIECKANTTVAVNVSDLQEMQNHMREQIDAGLKDMQSKAGSGGIPQAPASAKAAPSQPQYAAIAPPPSPQDQSDLEAQNKDAAAAESEAQQGGASTSSNPAPSSIFQQWPQGQDPSGGPETGSTNPPSAPSLRGSIESGPRVFEPPTDLGLIWSTPGEEPFQPGIGLNTSPNIGLRSEKKGRNDS
ncbi:MAG TPA: hypothetical protein VI320_19980 [Terracidiphilus sp.]|jgi:hypothetical protein